MEKCWNLRVGESCWRAVKQRALDEGVTVREVVERAVHRYLAEHGPGRPPDVREQLAAQLGRLDGDEGQRREAQMAGGGAYKSEPRYEKDEYSQ